MSRDCSDDYCSNLAQALTDRVIVECRDAGLPNDRIAQVSAVIAAEIFSRAFGAAGFGLLRKELDRHERHLRGTGATVQ